MLQWSVYQRDSFVLTKEKWETYQKEYPNVHENQNEKLESIKTELQKYYKVMTEFVDSEIIACDHLLEEQTMLKSTAILSYVFCVNAFFFEFQTIGFKLLSAK